jgi:hypothetical protein
MNFTDVGGDGSKNCVKELGRAYRTARRTHYKKMPIRPGMKNRIFTGFTRLAGLTGSDNEFVGSEWI